VTDGEARIVGFIDEATIARELLRARAADRADASMSGIRAINAETDRFTR
jgi:hypothetical protein